MKFIALILIIFLSGCASRLGAKPDTNDIVAFQEEQKKETGKYAHVPETKIDADSSYLVDEYVDAKGNVGYQVIEFEKKPDGIYSKSSAVGVEAKERTWDLKLITPTPVEGVASST